MLILRPGKTGSQLSPWATRITNQRIKCSQEHFKLTATIFLWRGDARPGRQVQRMLQSTDPVTNHSLQPLLDALVFQGYPITLI